ncbi:MAG: FAD-dependent oxidoreductase [Oscillospiraceae bacterium]|nr:FAD-dependent oxidoreductase [Oscillospiraceae bacterium]
MYDIAIIGAGAAGLTAALYALRANKTVLIIEKSSFGGQITFSPQVENFPTQGKLSGAELADKLTEQVLSHGAEVEIDTVTSIEDLGSSKRIVGESAKYEAKAVIIATGARHRMLGLPREEEFVGEGISFCAVCDGAFYKDKNVAVVGGGNSALQEAVLLSQLCSEVTIIQNLSELTGEKALQEQLYKKENVKILCSKTVAAFEGEKELLGVTIKDEVTGETESLTVDGVFIAIGLAPQNEPFKDVIQLDSYGYADSSEDCTTKTEGIFVAGDCRKKAVRQLTTACADGSVAALAACRYIESL